MKYIFTLICLLLFISACTPTQPQVQQKSTLSISEIDFFAREDLNSLDVNVLGIALGDSSSKVLELLGEPNGLINENQTTQGVENWGYNLERNTTSLVFNIHNGKVQKIVMYQGFQSHLQGSTSFSHIASDFYGILGKPTLDEELEGIQKRRFTYAEKGVEIYFNKGKYPIIYTLMYPL